MIFLLKFMVKNPVGTNMEPVNMIIFQNWQNQDILATLQVWFLKFKAKLALKSQTEKFEIFLTCFQY